MTDIKLIGSVTPLKSIIDTPLTDSLVNEIFHQQNNVKLYFSFYFNNPVFVKGWFVSSDRTIW